MYLEKKQAPITLKFSVTGKPVVYIEKIDGSLSLEEYIKEALKESASARPMEDYNAFYKSHKLNWERKTASYRFPNNAVIMLSMKTALGAEGNIPVTNKACNKTISKRN